MGQVTYRVANEADFPAIAEMYTKLDGALRRFSLRVPEVENPGEAYVESFRRTLGRYSIFFVAEMDGEVVGYQAARIKRLPAYMGSLLVGENAGKWTKSHARRLGIGVKLSRLALEWLRDQGVHSVEIQISEGNQASWALYQHLGFKPEWRLYRLLWEDYVPEEEPVREEDAGPEEGPLPKHEEGRS